MACLTIDERRQEVINHFKEARPLKLVAELTANHLNLVAGGKTESIEAPVKTQTIFDVLYQRTQSPLVISPSKSPLVPGTLSPISISSIWDSPETPCRQSPKRTSINLLTPLTPPTTCGKTKNRTFAFSTPISIVKTCTTLDQVQDRNTLCGDPEIEEKLSCPAAADFEPKKLIRGLTAEFLAIAQANIAAAQWTCNLKPTFHFNERRIPSVPIRPSERLNGQTSRAVTNGGVEARAKASPRDLKNRDEITSRSNSDNAFSILLEHIIPHDVHARLKQNPDKCAASLVTRPDKRCRYSAKGSLTLADDALRLLSDHNEDGDYAGFIEEIGSLVQAVLCGSHKNTATTRMIKLQKLTPVVEHMSEGEYISLVRWMATVSNPTASPAIQHCEQSEVREVRATRSSTSTNRKSAGAAPTVKSVAASTTVPLSYAISFIPYQPKTLANKPVKAALLSEINKPLKPTDLKPGYIYIFWDFEHFGMVKIGRTKNLQARLKQWNHQCKRTFSYHGELPRVPHVSRLERLIQVELKKCRMQRDCEGCGTMHQEWFNVGETKVLKVFEKWQRWIELEPYALDHKTGEWTIREEMMYSLDEVCEPVLVPEAPVESSLQRKSNRLKNGRTKQRARQTK
ncbi:DUF1766-domain-containing protein [Setomelanomma holmii]|uniref:DUF1766-domain-containing protein n=1 Tax=Setomelanomma holmii TaxID=210430 RepID=A0A9P4LI03_9PLEO|nr:DUF1766-domain-containing protein [Setomelanomma holmii]